MAATCRAVVFAGDGTWELRDDFSVPEPPAGGAVLAVEAVGLCHSDVAQLAGHHHVPGEVNPVVPGHEIVGRVHALARAPWGPAILARLVRFATLMEACSGIKEKLELVLQS